MFSFAPIPETATIPIPQPLQEKLEALQNVVICPGCGSIYTLEEIEAREYGDCVLCGYEDGELGRIRTVPELLSTKGGHFNQVDMGKFLPALFSVIGRW